jgi:hypothetical protein
MWLESLTFLRSKLAGNTQATNSYRALGIRDVMQLPAGTRPPLPRTKASRESDFDNDQVALRVSRREDGILTQSARMLRFPAV